MRRRRAVVVGAVGGLLLVATGVAGTAWALRGWDWARMRDQRRADAYAPSAVFPNGMVLQPPPEGTVPRERIVDAEGRTTGVVAGRPVGAIPIQSTRAVIDRGHERYGIYCAPCHGVAADGESVIASNMRPPRPPSLVSPRVRALPPGAIYRVIVNGFGRMPSYAAELTVDERWAIVAYLRTLQPADTSARTGDAAATVPR